MSQVPRSQVNIFPSLNIFSLELHKVESPHIWAAETIKSLATVLESTNQLTVSALTVDNKGFLSIAPPKVKQQ